MKSSEKRLKKEKIANLPRSSAPSVQPKTPKNLHSSTRSSSNKRSLNLGSKEEDR